MCGCIAKVRWIGWSAAPLRNLGSGRVGLTLFFGVCQNGGMGADGGAGEVTRPGRGKPIEPMVNAPWEKGPAAKPPEGTAEKSSIPSKPETPAVPAAPAEPIAAKPPVPATPAGPVSAKST